MKVSQVGQWDSKRLEGSSRPRGTSRKHSTSIFDALHDFIRYMKDERQASPYTLDAYERESRASGPVFVEIQNTMLFATVGQKAS